MTTNRGVIAIALLACASAAFSMSTAEAASSTGAAILEDIDIPHEVFSLDNGLTVIVHTDRSTPSVYMGLWYRVGSKDEPEGKTGFAHLFEHLMFEKTQNREAEFFELLSEAGAIGLNGTTTEDRTNYYVTVPTQALDLALWLESDRMISILGAVDEDMLDEQRAVVKNEKRQNENNPFAKLAQRRTENFYPIGHPYGHPVIGSMEDLDNASVDDVHAWFKTYYGATNAFLVLAGDIDVETAKQKVERYFAAASPGEPVSTLRQWVPSFDSNKTDVLIGDFPYRILRRVWPLPPGYDRETVVARLVAHTFAGNKNAPLRKKLVDDLQWAVSVSAGTSGGLLSGYLSLDVVVKPDADIGAVNAVIDETLATYLEDGPAPALLEVSKLSTNVNFVRGLENASSKGTVLAESMLLANDPDFYQQRLAWTNSASSTEVQRVAAKWLSRGHYQLTVLPFGQYESATADADRSALPPVPTTATEVRFPEIREKTLSNGAKIVVASQGDLPLINVNIAFDTGAIAEAESAPGAASAAFALLNKGTKSYDAAALSSAFDRIGISPTFIAGLERSQIGYAVLTPHFEDSLELVAGVLKHPTFPLEEVEKEIAKQAVFVRSAETDPAENAYTLFQRAIYGPDNVRGRVWTEDMLSRLSREKLVSFYEEQVAPFNMTIYIIGDIDFDAAERAVTRTLARWKPGVTPTEPPVSGPPPAKRPRVILVDKPGAIQSSILAGHLLPDFDAGTQAAMDVMNAVLGGTFTSRLNMNLREEKGWSYGVRSRIRKDPSVPQFIVVSGSVQTDKTVDSMKEIKREYSEFVSSRPVTPTEYVGVVSNKVRSFPSQFSKRFDFLSSIIEMDRYGLPYDYASSEAKRVEETTLAGVHRLAEAIIDPDNLVWVIVGDLSQIEDDIRSLGYGEVEVWGPYAERIR